MQIFTSFTPQVAQRFKDGQVAVIPTDTIYGLVADLSNQEAVERIYKLKARPANKPIGTILIAHSEQISNLANSKQLNIAASYWPGPVSVILDVPDTLQYAHRGLNSLPFRVPDYPELLLILDQTGPLATTSANMAGSPPIKTVDQAIKLFGNTVDFYVNGGDLSSHQASKIIRINEQGIIDVIRES